MLRAVKARGNRFPSHLPACSAGTTVLQPVLSFGVGSTLALDVAVATVVNAFRKPLGVNAILYWHLDTLCSDFVFWSLIGRLGRTAFVFYLLRRRTLSGAADGFCVVVCIRMR